jgi:proteasome assembly chaperone (PAC2) family protein
MHVSKGKNRDIVFLSGDVQPLDERASYEFCEKILDLAQELGCSEVITLGGIGLPTEIKNPVVFGAVTDKETLLRYKKFKSINFKANERVEAIFGASGLLLGLARLRDMTGISLLAETYAHQLHLGFSEAKVLLRELTNILDIKVSFAGLENQIKEKEQEKSRIRDLQKPIKALKPPVYDKTETPYIG